MIRRLLLTLALMAGCDSDPRLGPAVIEPLENGGSSTGDEPDTTTTGDESGGSTTGAEDSEPSTGDSGEPPEPPEPPTGPTCRDEDGSERPLMAPEPGDLVITEWMANAGAVPDTNGEWLEVLVTADVDINGLQLANDPGLADLVLPDDGDCIPIEAGRRLVFARSADPALNGGLPDVFGVFEFSLANSGGGIFVGRGGDLLDAVTWQTSTHGVAWTLDPGAENPDENDLADEVCLASAPYGAGDLGTPGEQGPECWAWAPKTCLGADGVTRDAVVPEWGDLVVSEWLADPVAVSDGYGEWIEVVALADAPIDINGLKISGSIAGVLNPAAPLLEFGDDVPCVTLQPGQVFVLLANGDPAINGGVAGYCVPNPWAQEWDPGACAWLGMGNAVGAVAFGVDGELLDFIDWTMAVPGASWAVDPAHLDPDENDDPANRCVPAIPTPGAMNPPC